MSVNQKGEEEKFQILSTHTIMCFGQNVTKTEGNVDSGSFQTDAR